VFENRVLRRIVELKRMMQFVGWKRLHNEEIHKLYLSPGIIRMVKSWWMRWMECSTNIWDGECI
jgi:hypothetical protein